MDVLCLDLEGVLIPEIWQAVADHTGVEALRKTTRDIPVYDDLMRLRLRLLNDHDLSMGLIESVIDALDPLPVLGQAEPLAWGAPDQSSVSLPVFPLPRRAHTLRAS